MISKSILILRNFFLFSFIIFLFNSCKDSTPITPILSENYIIYKTKKYYFDKSKINYLGIAPNPKSTAYKISFSLISKDIILSSPLIKGKGNILVFTFYTNQQKSIPSGIYDAKYFLSTDKALENFIDSKYSSFMLEYDYNSMTRSESSTINKGNVKVENNNGVYSFTINLTDTDGETVVGIYKGTPEVL